MASPTCKCALRERELGKGAKCEETTSKHQNMVVNLSKTSQTYAKAERLCGCNALCKCSVECARRFQLPGPTVPLQIYRRTFCPCLPTGTDESAGSGNGNYWALRTLERIEKGSKLAFFSKPCSPLHTHVCIPSEGKMILEYVGEIISNEEAWKRAQVYHASNSSGGDSSHCPILSVRGAGESVDVNRLGNVSRFLSSSCQPNLSVKLVSPLPPPGNKALVMFFCSPPTPCPIPLP